MPAQAYAQIVAGCSNPCSTVRMCSDLDKREQAWRLAEVYCRTLFPVLPMSYSANKVSCRAGCGACCTAPSITSPIPGMPNGKPAGVRCVQLTATNGCAIFGHPDRPAFCAGLQASAEMCGPSREHAIGWLDDLERATAPQV